MFPDNRIRLLRKEAGLSQAELGKRVGLHQTQIGNLENGARNLTFEWARRIARELNVTLADLLDENDNPDRLSPEERELVRCFRESTDEQQEIVRRVVEPLKPFRGAKRDAAGSPRHHRCCRQIAGKSAKVLRLVDILRQAVLLLFPSPTTEPIHARSIARSRPRNP